MGRKLGWISIQFTVVSRQLMPKSRQFTLVGVYRMKPVIEDDMVLGGNTVGPTVVNQCNTGGMGRRRSQVDPKA